MARRRRHTPEQIVRKLREADRLLAEGKDLEEVARHLEVSEQTYHRWRAQYGSMKADDVRRLKELEVENTKLKRIVADKELEIDALREIEEWRQRFGRSKDEEVTLLDRFRDPADPLKILIVTARLLTGFDAPNLQCM